MKSHLPENNATPTVDINITYNKGGVEHSRLVQLETDDKLILRRSLGNQQHRCGICGASGAFKTYLVPELFNGTKEDFRYFSCAECECLQIERVPEKLGEYYHHDYYSFQEPAVVLPEPGVAKNDEAILDVGCGNGAFLCSLAAHGYTNLLGCDPFIEKDRQYENGVHIRKCEIFDIEGSFDHIYFRDSLEHVTNPLETLQQAKRLLKPTGSCHITVPTVPNTAFDIYGPYWYQIDAPRHLFIPSAKSLAFLANACGLYVAGAEPQVNAWAFGVSRLYQKGVLFFQAPAAEWSLDPYYDEQQQSDFSLIAEVAASEGRSDHVDFTLKHIAAAEDIPSAIPVESGGESPLARILDLNDTMEAALQHLAQAAASGTLTENTFLLQDLLLANESIRQAFELLWLQGQQPPQEP